MVSSGIEPLIPALLARCLNQLGQETRNLCLNLLISNSRLPRTTPEKGPHGSNFPCKPSWCWAYIKSLLMAQESSRKQTKKSARAHWRLQPAGARPNTSRAIAYQLQKHVLPSVFAGRHKKQLASHAFLPKKYP